PEPQLPRDLAAAGDGWACAGLGARDAGRDGADPTHASRRDDLVPPAAVARPRLRPERGGGAPVRRPRRHALPSAAPATGRRDCLAGTGAARLARIRRRAPARRARHPRGWALRQSRRAAPASYLTEPARSPCTK